MSGKPGSPSRRSRSLAALVAVCLAVLLSAVPGVASAAPGDIVPFVDCYKDNGDGTYALVLGYENTGFKTIKLNSTKNRMYPAKFQGSQPTEFLEGEHHGVFSIQATRAELNTGIRWELDGTVLDSRTSSAPACAPSTPLPAIGNGTGLAIVLVAGGAFGVLFVRRLIRRASAPSRETTPTAR